MVKTLNVLANTSVRGMAGSITINATNSATFSGSDPNFSDRFARFSSVTANEGAASGVFALIHPLAPRAMVAV